MNAIRHGLLAETTVVQTEHSKEEPEAFKALLEGLRDDFKPDGAMGGLLVQQIAMCIWKSVRANRYETGRLRQGLISMAPADDESQEELDVRVDVNSFFRWEDDTRHILRYTTANDGQLQRAIDWLERLQQRPRGESNPPPGDLDV